jgi:hypothetical protein
MIIKSFLPNPVGKDTEGEEIILSNDSADTVSLRGWYVKDEAGKIYVLSSTVEPDGEIVLSYKQTKIPLNNNSETIYLYDRSNNLIDQLSFVGQAKEGLIVTREGSEEGVYGRAELLEDWIMPQGLINGKSQLPSFFLTMFVLAVIFASVSVYAYKKFQGN